MLAFACNSACMAQPISVFPSLMLTRALAIDGPVCIAHSQRHLVKCIEELCGIKYETLIPKARRQLLWLVAEVARHPPICAKPPPPPRFLSPSTRRPLRYVALSHHRHLAAITVRSMCLLQQRLKANLASCI